MPEPTYRKTKEGRKRPNRPLAQLEPRSPPRRLADTRIVERTLNPSGVLLTSLARSSLKDDRSDWGRKVNLQRPLEERDSR
jgi:hypothetical protein